MRVRRHAFRDISWGTLESVYINDEDRNDSTMLVCGIEKSFVSVWKVCSFVDEDVSKLDETVAKEEEEEVRSKCDPYAKTMIHESKISENSSKISDVDDDLTPLYLYTSKSKET